MNRNLLFIFFIVSFFSSIAVSQSRNDEITPSVPELKAMHEPIFKLWHTAWPHKNIPLIKNIYPDIEQAFQKLDSATLPGILRDKKNIWDEKLNALRQSVDKYKSAVQANDSTLLILAVEQVHTNYEILVRTIRPVMKEIETFHQSLYLLHHYYIVDYNVEKIIESADSLSMKMSLIENAELPERLVKKKSAYEKARLELSNAVVEFATAVKSRGSKSHIIESEQLLHQKYEQLEKVFQ